jgi:hypothetical protein
MRRRSWGLGLPSPFNCSQPKLLNAIDPHANPASLREVGRKRSGAVGIRGWSRGLRRCCNGGVAEERGWRRRRGDEGGESVHGRQPGAPHRPRHRSAVSPPPVLDSPCRLDALFCQSVTQIVDCLGTSRN